jgi:hypothetical protein
MGNYIQRGQMSAMKSDRRQFLWNSAAFAGLDIVRGLIRLCPRRVSNTGRGHGCESFLNNTSSHGKAQ